MWLVILGSAPFATVSSTNETDVFGNGTPILGVKGLL